MVEVTRVIIYGYTHAVVDHDDYALFGEWRFDLYNRALFSVQEPTKEYRVQYRYLAGSGKKGGQFAKGPTHQDKKGTWRFLSGQFASGPTKETHVPIPPQEKETGRYTEAKPIRLIATAIPDDDTIVADVLGIVEQQTGHRLYRTPTQQEKGLDRIKIGIQDIAESEIKNTYTYDEFLSELRHRVKNQWSNR